MHLHRLLPVSGHQRPFFLGPSVRIRELRIYLPMTEGKAQSRPAAAYLKFFDYSKKGPNSLSSTTDQI